MTNSQIETLDITGQKKLGEILTLTSRLILNESGPNPETPYPTLFGKRQWQADASGQCGVAAKY